MASAGFRNLEQTSFKSEVHKASTSSFVFSYFDIFSLGSSLENTLIRKKKSRCVRVRLKCEKADGGFETMAELLGLC